MVSRSTAVAIPIDPPGSIGPRRPASHDRITSKTMMGLAAILLSTSEAEIRLASSVTVLISRREFGSNDGTSNARTAAPFATSMITLSNK